MDRLFAVRLENFEAICALVNKWRPFCCILAELTVPGLYATTPKYDVRIQFKAESQQNRTLVVTQL